MSTRSYWRDLLLQANLQPNHQVLILGGSSHELSNLTLIFNPEVKVIEGVNLIKNAYSAESFDYVFSIMNLHTLDTYEKLEFLQEIYRLLRPGGALLLLDWGKTVQWWVRIFTRLKKRTALDNLNGLLPLFISDADFECVQLRRSYSTWLGTICLHSAKKRSGNQ